MAGCVCRSNDAYDCWALRYFHSTNVAPCKVEADGGPCECACHDGWWCDDGDDDYP